ncbi:AAA family ATPase [Pseudomonas tohonis]|uniref:AAA family ATPase n=1 Tax=Pseudomonas tohonis TaxID=2725477 RepID=UPI0022F0E7F4|nr:AAA family ATPase [Pseudomonas tohonis]
MQLNNLSLLNFRCFEELHLELDPKLTVIIADNGAGKTAILDAIAIGLGRYLTRLPGISSIATKDSDVRKSEREKRTLFTMLKWQATTHEGEAITWSGGRRRDSSVTNAKIRNSLSGEFLEALPNGAREINSYVQKIIEAEDEEEPYFLPVVAYYGTNRSIRDEVQRRRGHKKNLTRFDALANALDPAPKFRTAFEWFSAMEDQERRNKELHRNFDYKLPELQAVREAITRMLPEGFKNPRTETRPLRFVIDRQSPDGITRTLRITELSDGYKVILGLVMDFARRLAQANSALNLGLTAHSSPLDQQAIVLIDEVDLHLHPSWQQHIITDLMRTFPGTQFIITTHSPQVLSTVKRNNIRVIETNTTGKTTVSIPLAMTYGEPSGDVMHSVMLVDPQPPIAEKQQLNKLTELVDTGRYDEPATKSLFTELKEILGEHHPQLLRLDRSIKRQKALSK